MKKRNARAANSLTRMAVAAMLDAIAKVIKDHRRRGMSLAVWENGKVVLLKPNKTLIVRERSSAYTARKKKIV